MYDKYLDQFIPSKEMADYLKTVERMSSNLAEIIFFSASPLMEKYEALKEVGPSILASGNEYAIRDYKDFIMSIEMAIDLRDAEGVFTIEPQYFTENTTEADSEFTGVFATYEDVLHSIQEELAFSETQAEDIHWFEVTKWIKNDQGKYIPACRYIFAHDVLISVEVDEDITGEHLCYYGISELNLPVPFKTGDIVEVDGYPFTPKKRILILEVGDNWDCCCLQGLFKDYDGKWTTGAVKHNHIGFEAFPQMSPLYTIHSYTHSLDGEEALLKEVSDWLAGDEEKGSKLWEKFFDVDGMSTDDVRGCMQSIDSELS